MTNTYPYFDTGCATIASGPLRFLRKPQIFAYRNIALPLIISGSPGSGKTHMICHNLTGTKPFQRIFISIDMTTISHREMRYLIKIIPADQTFENTAGKSLSLGKLMILVQDLINEDTPSLWLIDDLQREAFSGHHNIFSSFNRSLHKKNSLLVYTTQSMQHPSFRDMFRTNHYSLLMLKATQHDLLFASDTLPATDLAGLCLPGGTRKHIEEKRTNKEVHPNLMMEPGKHTISLSPREYINAIKICEMIQNAETFIQIPDAPIQIAAHHQINDSKPRPKITTKKQASEQAKARLIILKKEKPDARLFEAYDLIAREQGFRNWQTMRASLS